MKCFNSRAFLFKKSGQEFLIVHVRLTPPTVETVSFLGLYLVID